LPIQNNTSEESCVIL